MKPTTWMSAALLFALALAAAAAEAPQDPNAPLCVSGVYPHLTVYNSPSSGEVGIGAIVPWAGKLWAVTYTQHAPTGSADKLYAIDDKLNMEIRPESVGGTPAGRLIHKESNQLFIGHYAIDAQGKVRVIDIKKMPLRVAAIARHLTDSAGKVLYFDMEGPVWEVDVKTLEPKMLFKKPVPGWHGKGCYTGQGRFILANNGESGVGKDGYKDVLVGGKAEGPEDAGVLAEWDGKTWKIIERRQFTDVTGPGGVSGAPDDKAPVWAIGWDRRSILLKLCDGGKWSTFRLPKANHTYDPKHGWYTEWPRIREITGGKYLMDMDGMLFDFPKTFSAANTAGIAPISSHLRYIPDYCDWNGRLVISTDETTKMANPMVGQCQSNLWFGKFEDLKEWGPRQGWGGPWDNDAVQAGVPSDPFLIHGFDRKVVHLANGGAEAVKFTLEIDAKGDGQWAKYKAFDVPAKGYQFHLFPAGFDAQWIRATSNRATTATAYFHYTEPGRDPAASKAMFACLAEPGDKAARGGLLRPGAETRNLIYVEQVSSTHDGAKSTVKDTYYEVDEKLAFSKPAKDKTDTIKKICKTGRDGFDTRDDAALALTWKGKRYRLPVANTTDLSNNWYDGGFAAGYPRTFREVESERTMLNAFGTFYLMPRDTGIPEIQPVCTHNKQIADFCTWRGLLVMAGTRADAKPDGHYFGNGEAGLWFGAIDDMWKMGKPVGFGALWNAKAVKPRQPSDPFLMTGYDKKTVTLAQQAAPGGVGGTVNITLEVDFDHTGQWHKYQSFKIEPGQKVTHVFPEGFAAHWVRAIADKPCVATVSFVYE